MTYEGQRIIITISGEKYDVTDFCTIHPGGRELLVLNNQRDVTSSFYYFQHSDDAKLILRTLNVKYKNKPNKSFYSLSSAFFSSVSTSSPLLLSLYQYLYPYFYTCSRFGLYWYIYFRFYTYSDLSYTMLWICIYLFIHVLPFNFTQNHYHILLFTFRSCCIVILNWLYHLDWISMPMLDVLKSIWIYSSLFFIHEPASELVPFTFLNYGYEYYQFQAMYACLSGTVMIPFIAMWPNQILILFFSRIHRRWSILLEVLYCYLHIIYHCIRFFLIPSLSYSGYPEMVASMFYVLTVRRFPNTKYMIWFFILMKYILK